MSGRRQLYSALTLAIAAGCASAPEPLELPSEVPTVRYAPAVRPTAPDATARAVAADLFAVAAVPEGPAVLTAAAAVSRDRGAPFHGSARLPAGSRWLAGDRGAAYGAELLGMAPHEAQRLGTARAAIVPGGRTMLTVENLPLPTIRFEHTGRGVEVALVTPGSEDAPGEAVILADPLAVAVPTALFVPAESRTVGGYVLVLRGLDAAEPAELDAARQAIAAAEEPPPADDTRPRALIVAQQAVGEHNRRPALLALFARHELACPVDLVLAGDERALIRITEGLASVDLSAADAAWSLERATWRALVPRAERGELTPALTAAFARHLGSVADDPTSLRQLLDASEDTASFRTALRDENLAALGDRSAALRVVAFRWLSGNGSAPAGYDPLSDKQSRRAALRRHMASEDGGGTR